MKLPRPFCNHGHDMRVTGQTPKRQCKECGRLAIAAWQKRNRERMRTLTREWASKIGRAKRYGLTPGQLEQMVKSRKGRCDICVLIGDLSVKSRLCVDHDKETGQIRGMLCTQHNSGIGYFHHSPQEMMAGCEYMKKHSQLRLVAHGS